MAFELWHLWIIAGILLFVLEIFTPGFVAAAIAVGCLAGALPAFLGASAAWQLGAFAAGTLVAFVGARPFVLRHLERGDGYLSNVEGLLGRDGTVLEGIPGQAGGRVLVGGEDWRAVSASGEALEVGQSVTVVAVEGNKLVVLRADAFEKR
jgi:membrane protein implicated in regulation of membrane protease activity